MSLRKIKYYIHITTEYLLDIIFPPTDLEKKIRKINSENIYQKCIRADNSKISARGTTAVFDYRDELVRSMVHFLKFRGNLKIAKILAEVLYNEILEDVAEMKIFSNFTTPLIIPIPISSRRLRERGFNQTEIIVKEMVILDQNNSFSPEINNLIKIKNTPAQSSLKNRRDRMKNPKGCFSLKYPEKIKGRNIILIDDVITTGATIAEAKSILKKAGAKKIITLTFAH